MMPLLIPSNKKLVVPTTRLNEHQTALKEIRRIETIRFQFALDKRERPLR
jgi:2-oxo-4-hydroxy-4-carboxy--5-ureidoimidazoline (OHCU) decarboxylase